MCLAPSPTRLPWEAGGRAASSGLPTTAAAETPPITAPRHLGPRPEPPGLTVRPLDPRARTVVEKSAWVLPSQARKLAKADGMSTGAQYPPARSRSQENTGLGGAGYAV